MKKIIYASILTVVLVLALSGCSKSREVTLETDETSWDYTEPRTSYEAKYQSEYWNLLGNNAYSKMYYESALESSDDIKKKIYLFYGDKDDSYTVDALKGIHFARLDHPEQKLRACSKLQTNTIFAQTIYGAIVNKEATSEGMADAYKYICNCCNLEELDISCTCKGCDCTSKDETICKSFKEK